MEITSSRRLVAVDANGYLLRIVAMGELIPVLAAELSALRLAGRQRFFDQYQQGCSDCRYDQLLPVTGGRGGCEIEVRQIPRWGAQARRQGAR